jgi:prepilin peptidase CpaA
LRWEFCRVSEYLLLLAFPAAMVFAGAMDLLTMTIPNRISLFLVAAFAVAAPLAGLSIHDILVHLAAGSAVLAIGIVLFSLGWLGGGDAKLMAAAALWFGTDNLVMYFAQVAVFGGVLAVAILLYRRIPVPAIPVPAWAERLHQKNCGIPYGIAIAAAALKMYPNTPWFTAFSS